MKPATNVAASVRQKLLNKARSSGRPFNELLQYYAMERFLYRLALSDHAERFILKGALMLRAWRAPEARPTMDIDMLGRTSNTEADIIAQIQDILDVAVADDGLAFEPDSILAERITEDADYEGIRVRFKGSLGVARISMQIDIGFGDIVHPGPQMAELPTILNQPAPQLLCYSRESAIAEKFEAMVKLGSLNSRMKDFYDIWLLSRQFEFYPATLTEAIRLTLNQRGTALPKKIEAFSPDFIIAKQVQWTAFRKRIGQEHVPVSFEEVIAGIEAFLGPTIQAISMD